jgi:hypothetical protein
VLEKDLVPNQNKKKNAAEKKKSFHIFFLRLFLNGAREKRWSWK